LELYPASAVLKLFEQTQEWKCIPDLQEHLFLTTTTLYCPAAVDTIL
ncbi:10897_t:CDS:1, partial [Gigaspora rosea]